MGESTCGSRWLWSRVQGLKATMMMIIAQVISAGINILYIFVGNDGMNLSILMTYRFLCASIVVAPLALLVERNKRPKLTWTILLQAALCALFGGPMALIMYAESVILTSPTLAAAFSNLIPPFTFILAVLFRLESVNLGQMGGKAKVIGTLMGVGGAMLLTFYKGPSINIWSTHFHLLPKRVQPRVGDVASTHQNSFNDHIIGSKMEPMEARLEHSIAYSSLSGPLFVSSFNPLVVVLVAIAGSLVLGEQLHVGSVLGSTIIIAGLYMVLWGKSKDIKRPPKFLSSTNSELLEIRKEDTSTIITTSTNILGTSYTAPTISSKEDEDHELQVKSEMGKHKDQEIDEAKN
ncbi:Drug/metabolite transporter [Cynara cardunculus var. scolymus]|uniref:WAT1-related protein n=1 Tax=Cynara cardunculus var. scolymus TaxID=59895 RepID=A0A103Y3E6_CYNCS|nr:Drug/metabolite transporter [Cynara cardunculus var. scolymus]